MTGQSFGVQPTHEYMLEIEEGMEVYDRDNKKVGTVEEVFIGESSSEPHERGRESVTGSETDPGARQTFLDDIIRGFNLDEDLPETVRARMRREGFIRVDRAGLLGSDRIILPDEIASVSEGKVQLKVARDELDKS